MQLEVPFRFENERLLWMIEDVYTREECDRFIEFIEAANPGLATNNPMYRDQDRVMRNDAATAQELFRRLRPHLPERMGELTLVGLNELLRMYRYRTGQQFAAHMDHWYRPNDRQITLHTVLVYLNDDFDGGETRFTEQFDETVKPKAGAVLVFQHKLRHEGCPVLRGKKYAIRTDVIYELS